MNNFPYLDLCLKFEALVKALEVTGNTSVSSLDYQDITLIIFHLEEIYRILVVNENSRNLSGSRPRPLLNSLRILSDLGANLDFHERRQQQLVKDNHFQTTGRISPETLRE